MKGHRVSFADPVVAGESRPSPPVPKFTPEERRACIRAMAYDAWVRGGQRSGLDLQYWLGAEREFCILNGPKLC
jgi:hypothetical protein